jgi:uncharacterized membrane protein
MPIPVNSERSGTAPADQQFNSDQEFDRLLGNLLITGVAVAALVVLAGGITYLVRHGAQYPDYKNFRGEPDSFRTVSGILKSATEWSGRGLIQLGLLLLIATPVARVAFSLLVFLRQRDFLYCACTLIVLAVLLFSLAGHHL